MPSWSAQEWTTLLTAVITAAISSLAAAVVLVLHAVKSAAFRDESRAEANAVKEQLDTVAAQQERLQAGQIEHERQATLRARLPVAGRLRPPAAPSDMSEGEAL
jgi:hypothetical protein